MTRHWTMGWCSCAIALTAAVALATAGCDGCQPELREDAGGAPDARADVPTASDATEADDAAVPGDAGTPDSADAAEPADAARDAGVDASPDSGADAAVDAGADASRADAGADAAVEPPLDCPATAGFCWLHPRGFGANLAAVSGTGAGDVWAVGPAGVIFHHDGATWTQWPSPSLEDWNDVHALSQAEAWAVGADGSVARFDGEAWRPIPGAGTDDLYGVFALASDQVWMVGADDVYRYDGQDLVAQQVPDGGYGVNGRALVAFAADDVWVGTAYGNALHFDGEAWADTDGPYFDEAVTDLWGSRPDDVWLVTGWGAQISRWDGEAWHTVPYERGVTPESVVAVHGSTADDVWLVGELGLWHYDGAAYTRHDPPVAPSGSSAPQGVWVGTDVAVVVGLAGQVFRRAGGDWALVSGAAQSVYQRWFSLAAPAPDDVWAFGLGTSLHFDGRGFTEVPTVETQWRQDFVGAWAAAPDDIWIVAVGNWGDNVQRYDGHGFARVDLGEDMGSDWYHDVWGSGPDDVYLTTMDSAFHWTGQGAERIDSLSDCAGVHGTHRGDVWMACGDGGWESVPAAPHNGLWHFDGEAWTQIVHDQVWWSSIYAVAADHAWAGGGGGTIKRWDGVSWSTTPVEGFSTQDPLNAPFVSAFAGRDPDDMWAVGGGRVLHWDGARWSVLPPFGVALNDIAMAPDGALFVTGSGDALLRRR